MFDDLSETLVIARASNSELLKTDNLTKLPAT